MRNPECLDWDCGCLFLEMLLYWKVEGGSGGSATINDIVNTGTLPLIRQGPKGVCLLHGLAMTKSITKTRLVDFQSQLVSRKNPAAEHAEDDSPSLQDLCANT